MKSGKNSKQIYKLFSLQNELQLKKKQCLQLSISLKSIENRNAILIKKNENIQQQFYALKQVTDNIINNQKCQLQILQDRIKELLTQKRQIRIKYDAIVFNNDALKIQYQTFKDSKELQIENIKTKYQQQLQQYHNSQFKYKNALNQHQKLIKQVNEVKSCKQKQKEAFLAKLADKQRQRIQSIDLIKKQMINKACQMRNKALQIRKQQLQISTRLTYLQNDQLVRQLEYQSTQTEQILKRNSQLQKQVKQLKRQIEVHEGVQKQIVKRNVIAKNLIGSLSKQLKTNQATNNKSSIKVSRFSLQQTHNLSQKITNNKNQKQNQEKFALKKIKQEQEESQNIYFLKQALNNLKQVNERLNKQVDQQKQRYQNLKLQFQQLQKKVGLNNCNDIATLLNKYYEQFLYNTNELVQKQNNRDIIQQDLKNISVQQWPYHIQQNAIKLLMNSLRPYLANRVIKLPYFKAKNKTKSLDYQSLKQNTSSSKYMQALKRQKITNIQRMKQRSVTYIMDQSLQKSKISKNRRVSVSKISPIGNEPIVSRFLKPHFITRS